ncbi:MAG: polysaccharide deacetylase family protein [Acidobacteria bacterium]|nr:polysaccharide deacetylase family protein [Acidobacteriota bacterium]
MKLTASLSLDLDNKWSYMKTHGDAGWEAFPSYLDLVVPRFLEILDALNLRISVFIVGQDAALASNRAPLQAISAAGHEICNHSFAHEPWLHLYAPQQIDDEIARAEEAIAGATGKRPRGFRGPGFSLSKSVLETLAKRGYAYDCSTFPTYLGPLARAYYFKTAKLTAEERKERAKLFGGLGEGRRPLHAYRWQLDAGTLLEIPVTTMPLFKLPFHVSYLLYLCLYSPPLASLYYRISLALCRAARVEPSVLLHPLDFLGGDEVPELAFFPAMRVTGEKKRAWTRDFLARLSRDFNVVSMEQHALELSRRELRRVVPDLPGAA